MDYNNFSLQDAIGQFDLNLIESAFCESLPPASPKPEFLNIFDQYLPLARKAKSEKAKSELLVSPILVELLRLADDRIQLFSGEEFNVDKERGLNGFCDFLLSKSAISSIIQAPIVMASIEKDILALLNCHIHTSIQQRQILIYRFRIERFAIRQIS